MSRKVELRTPDELRKMRAAGLLVARTLAALRAAIAPGVSTGELDDLARTTIEGAGGVPSFLGYHGFPASTCISVGAEVIHGIPRPDRVLAVGDVVSVDCGAIVDGWHGDAAFTAVVGGSDAAGPGVRHLVEQTEQALWAGLAAAAPGGRLGDIGTAVDGVLSAAGLGGLRDYTGHGIGRAMHTAPDVENRPGGSDRRLRLEPGLALAIEPMATLGAPAVHELDDGWTVVTDDGQPGAHWEHTVAVTPTGPWVLTAFDGGLARLGDRASDEARREAA
ncbi:MAG TPA: type I methionyl aminopeptidase [Mycobacteriales bacterium]|nr:type I methionyl aminopeptidase [Mycobacteriales bacterium]